MNDNTQLLRRLIDQLDSLISFMGLSHEEVFDLLQQERRVWFGDSEDRLPEAYSAYRKQVTHSAFLLGYSYFESFLTDILGAILHARPSMLPKDRKLPYSDILASDSKSDLLDQMIKREILDLLYKSMPDILAVLQGRYGFTISEEQVAEMSKASCLRNCILHNATRADSRLAQFDGFREGEEFELTSGQVHGFGITLRSLVRTMASQANTNHGIGIEQAH